jgi:hypothetical protein
MQCSTRGVTADAACDCGAPYVPVSARAAEAIKANLEKSNRAIASELGVSTFVVNEARKELGVRYLSPERQGRDGRSYAVKRKRSSGSITKASASMRRPARRSPGAADDDIDCQVHKLGAPQGLCAGLRYVGQTANANQNAVRPGRPSCAARAAFILGCLAETADQCGIPRLRERALRHRVRHRLVDIGDAIREKRVLQDDGYCLLLRP